MRKIIAVYISLTLLCTNILPVMAQLPPRRILVQSVPKNLSTFSNKLLTSGPQRLYPNVSQAALQNMRLPVTMQYTHLLSQKSYVPAARQILTFADSKSKALMLRTDFVALTLQKRVSADDIALASQFYRTNLQKKGAFSSIEAVADIASLGILGDKSDAPLILQVAKDSIGKPQEPVITAAAARALLRLKAYKELEQLDDISWLQPELWDGIQQYVELNQLPVKLFKAERKNVDISNFKAQAASLGPLNYVVTDPSVESTFLYMNAGKVVSAQVAKHPAVSSLTQPMKLTATQTPVVENPSLFIRNPAVLTKARISPTTRHIKTPASKAVPQVDNTTWTQRAALYLTAFSIGLEIGTPIMASIKSALNLPLSYAILVTVASFSPYLFGSFLANWLKGKIGRKGTINTGLAMMGGSFALGAAALGLDGSFTAWADPLAQYFGILATLTTAGTGAVFIQNAAGPVMTEISKTASELVRQQRGTYIELSRAAGMMASYAFPFLATSVLGMDWSAPFILALPFVGASAAGLNLAKLPNTKPHVTHAAPSSTTDFSSHSKISKLKENLRNNSYIRLLREEPGVANFIGGLFTMNAVEVAINSGFLFMLPQLVKHESSQYLFGMIQYAVAFVLGRYLARHFLKWFPKHSLSIATLIAALGTTASLASLHNVYGLTAALFTAELGISTTFTLSFAQTAKNHHTQDRITSLIMASAISCAIGPMLLTQGAQILINAGILSEADATTAALIAIPAALSFLSAKLFANMEGGKLITSLKSWVSSLKKNLRTKSWMPIRNEAHQ